MGYLRHVDEMMDLDGALENVGVGGWDCVLENA